MMPLSEIFFFGIVFYILYKFVFNLFLPIFKTTRAFKQQFRNMRDNMQDQTGPFQHSRAQTTQTNTSQNAPFETPPPKKPAAPHPANSMGEYIDFEEIK